MRSGHTSPHAEWVLQPVLISGLSWLESFTCLEWVAWTCVWFGVFWDTELQARTDCSQTFILLNVMHVSSFTAVSHHLAYIHMFFSTLEGSAFIHEKKKIGFKQYHDTIPPSYTAHLLVMKFDSSKA